MKLLLDTHTFLWMDGDTDKLSPSAVSALSDPANRLMLSVVSLWEMMIKVQAGKLQLRLPLAQILETQQANGVLVLPVRPDHVLAVEALPMIHKDPFDRLLIAQAIVEGTGLVSADSLFGQYPVPVVW